MTTTAQYHGTCAECTSPIIPGQLIFTDGAEWVHRECGARAETVECVCERCWLVHAQMQTGCDR